MIWLLAFGSVAAILNLITQCINIVLAVRRTKIQSDLYKWRREEFDREHPQYKKDKTL